MIFIDSVLPDINRKRRQSAGNKEKLRRKVQKRVKVPQL